MGNFRERQGGFGSDRRRSFGRRNSDGGDRREFGRPRFGGGNRGGRSFGDRERRDFQEKFKIKCDKCGKEDEVPFKPTQGKPILCKECFAANKPAPVQEQLDSINTKLDKIIEALNK